MITERKNDAPISNIIELFDRLKTIDQQSFSGDWSLQIRVMSHGRSLSQSQNAFLKPPSDNEKDRTVTAVKSKQKRQANVYDAIAGEYFSVFSGIDSI